MGSITPSQPIPSTLLNLFSNSLLLQQTAPYLPIAARYALAATSKAFRHLVLNSTEIFRYTDLSTVSSAVIPYVPIDSGGISWRSQRMDEALTEDEFYSGPLRGIFSKLERRNVLKNVQTLVLDGLSVPADLVREIIADLRFNVRILSLREAKNLNERKLMQVLTYACRPTRPEGTPKLRGLYFFSPRDTFPTEKHEMPKTKNQRAPDLAVVTTMGAQIGAKWNQRSTKALNETLTGTQDKWYQPSGRLIQKRPALAEWAETIKTCEGVIYFDAVLCQGPRHDINKAYLHSGQNIVPSHPYAYLSPAIATVALGKSCGPSLEKPPIYGCSAATNFPLLTPPNIHSATIRAAQAPLLTENHTYPPLYVRCEECLRGRWCERCNKWWDESYYIGAITPTRDEESQQEDQFDSGPSSLRVGLLKDTKVGVRRECFGCGFTCAECSAAYIRACQKCQNEYCILDNDACSATTCDWCNYTSRRTVELY